MINKTIFECDYCGTSSSRQTSEYIKYKKHFCSKKCRNIYYKDNSISNIITFTCEYCGKDRTRRSSYRKDKNEDRFCSNECHNNLVAEQSEVTVLFLCGSCKKLSFKPRADYGHNKKNFCSNRCMGVFNRHPEWTGNPQDSNKRWARLNPERAKIHTQMKNAQRRARDENAEGSYTHKEWESLKKKFHNRCAFCCIMKILTIDHVIPLSKGGSNYISNIQPLCINCNSRKHNKLDYVYDLRKSSRRIAF